MSSAFRPFCVGAVGALLAASLACVTRSAPPGPLLNVWVGHSERSLVDVWGFPDERYPAADWEFLVYRSKLPRAWRWFDAASLRCEISFGLYRDRVSVTFWSGEAWICARLAESRPPPPQPVSAEPRR